MVKIANDEVLRGGLRGGLTMMLCWNQDCHRRPCPARIFFILRELRINVLPVDISDVGRLEVRITDNL